MRSSSGCAREKVVGGALSVEPERVVEAVSGALRGIVERERVTVLVNPDDLEIVREAMDGLKASLGGIDHCVVEAERRVGRGGCLVRTPVGDIDARSRPSSSVRARSSPPRSGAHDLPRAADKTSVFSVMDAALDAVGANEDLLLRPPWRSAMRI